MKILIILRLQWGQKIVGDNKEPFLFFFGWGYWEGDKGFWIGLASC